MQPYDENEIEADDIIIRRIDPNEHIVPDDNTGGERISSKAFSASSGDEGGMSVDVEKLIVADGVEPMDFVTTPRFTGSVYFIAESIRERELMIGYEPIEGNPYHGEVWRSPNGGRFTRAQKKALRETAEWYVELPGVALK
ncbi:hypothetical protein [Henriciella sp.]|uniref:hypothetical protein n=1 Tax=Henriciella sp. TaxID=1968823 RepID=UPI002630AB39|nr:hypothetical protein [Henriciella sp.]